MVVGGSRFPGHLVVFFSLRDLPDELGTSRHSRRCNLHFGIDLCFCVGKRLLRQLGLPGEHVELNQ